MSLHPEAGGISVSVGKNQVTEASEEFLWSWSEEIHERKERRAGRRLAWEQAAEGGVSYTVSWNKLLCPVRHQNTQRQKSQV